jgi:two-component sensor histidine kinase
VLEKLCRKFTNLNEEDIEKIKSVESNLPLIANLFRTDVFIDCMTRDNGVAIVVAQAGPSYEASIYKESVIGQFAYRRNEPAAIRTLELGMPTRDLRAVTQEELPVKQTVVPIKNDQGKTIACLIVEMNVQESENDDARMQILSKTTEQLSETLMSSMDDKLIIQPYLSDGIVIFDSNGFSRSLNPVAVMLYRKLGYRDELVNIPFDDLTLDKKRFDEIRESATITVSEVEIGGRTLHIKYANLSLSESDFAGLIMVIKDITDKRAVEKELISKSVAIREIHHRVKNNLQTIASLLKLQSRRIDNKEAKHAFDESISRVISIAVTHEILAQNGVDDVDVKTILKKITQNVIGLHSSACNVDVQIEGDTFEISSDVATSIALVVNELLQNSLEYAFPDRDKGKIRIAIQRGIQYSNISVEDDGVGFDIKTARKGSLGMKIIRSIIQDNLKGRFDLETGKNGTKVTFDFKMKSDGLE